MVEGYTMTDLTIKAHIEDYGVPSRMVCPYCGGGSTKEACMTIFFADNERTVLATCHRAHCDIETIALDGYEIRTRVASPALTKDRLTQSMYDAAVMDWMEGSDIPSVDRPELLRGIRHIVYSRFVRWVKPGRLAVKQLNEHNQLSGIVLRSIDPEPGTTKSYTFSAPGHHGMGFFSDNTSYPEVVDPMALVVVEDSFSAMVAASHGWDAVSLNGTHINEARWNALRSAHDRIIICLDADATRDAIRIASKFYGQGSVEVRRLHKDFKNMTPLEFRRWEEKYLTG